MVKRYTKPSVQEGQWFGRASFLDANGKIVAIKRQYIDNIWQDHYAIYIDGKRQRKTYFGESAHNDVARAYNDLAGWQNSVFGDEL